jgi:hypothetical protein
MDPKVLAVIVAVAVLAAVALIYYMQGRRRAHLRGRFGPEYDRTVKESGDIRRAEETLAARERRVAGLTIRPLSPEDQSRFSQSWAAVQNRFVDDPKGAVSEADRLVGEVMQVRGYPLGEFEQRAADISVDHPHVVDHYRAARDIAQRHVRGEASTEDLRQAFVHYRALFSDLLTVREPALAGRTR